ncbi:MAG: small ribosomal subunit biogenesis GTPase RsgA [Chromatiaceae bacterium]|nr:small ribosomal subunit biogenesis GTPase RsgA [Gammaproteobacteria bacterium]MCP5304116.1 small ribosomal subunit biogenesis GTPase RsgA [Chromatiaceae bacterium]MCP5313842.1 small ribosomal subunit biogenesis GTPase RsgA [Chromatiaceae bacterium]
MARRRLSKQQQARIARIQEQRRQRADARAEHALAGTDQERQHAGRVVVRHGRNLTVRTPLGDELHAMFRANLGEVVCGDNVVWQPVGDGEAVVVAVQPRVTALTRPAPDGQEKAIAANITQLVVVLAARPEPTGYLLDQYLVAAERIGVRGVICLNKVDLLDEAGRAAFHARFEHYEQLGYPLIEISAKTEHGLDPLLAHLRGETSILVGQSGVGKSSLINALIPHRRAEEGQLSEATGLGRHTTSAATLYPLEHGGDLIDSPGVRSFRLGPLSRQELERGFRDFLPFLGQCRFHNCAHLAEPGCAIRAAVEAGKIHPSRLESYQHMAAAVAEPE